MKYKLITGIIIVFLAGIGLGGVYVYLRQNGSSLWLLPGILIIPVLVYFFLDKKLIKPYQLIVSSMKLLNEQDFSTRLRPVKNKEANQMIEVFNRMMTNLRKERLSVREKNQFLDLLIQASPQGIIILDFNERISDINSSGLKLLQIDSLDDVRGKTLLGSEIELSSRLAGMKRGDEIVVQTSGRAIYRCVRSSFADLGFEHPFILIEEFTRELLKTEKDSYERIIRMMSHEVNNSVGAIGSTLNVLSEILEQDEQNTWKEVVPILNASHDRCHNLAQFVCNLAEVVKIPAPTPSLISLNEQIRAVDALTRSECLRRNIHLHLSLAEKDQSIYVDGIQFEQVLVNIIKNAYEAIGENGEIRIITRTSPLSIVVEDNGPGIPDEVKEKLFTPFFSTKSTGQGIGLMFVRDVLINHKCKFSLTSENGWTKFEILLP
ncbi:MAG: ATP-binding protein [Bacteroides sp.]|nr:ATP-binding protein [Bacteroides sp.]